MVYYRRFPRWNTKSLTGLENREDRYSRIGMAEHNYNLLPKVGYELQPVWDRNLYGSAGEITIHGEYGS